MDGAIRIGHTESKVSIMIMFSHTVLMESVNKWMIQNKSMCNECSQFFTMPLLHNFRFLSCEKDKIRSRSYLALHLDLWEERTVMITRIDANFVANIVKNEMRKYSLYLIIPKKRWFEIVANKRWNTCRDQNWRNLFRKKSSNEISRENETGRLKLPFLYGQYSGERLDISISA